MIRSVVVQVRAFPWWVVLIEGIAAVVVGVLLIAAPQATMALVIQVFGLYWLIDGLIRIASIFTDPIDRGLKLEAGIIGILAGLAVLFRPLWLAEMLNWMLIVALGGAGVLIGIISIYQAVRGAGWGALALGLLSLLFGVALLVNPWVESVMLVPVYGWLSVAGGAFAIVMAFRLRRASEDANPTPA